jgi:cyclophilin family peptidyl-prolyl cis-trans isomerase
MDDSRDEKFYEIAGAELVNNPNKGLFIKCTTKFPNDSKQAQAEYVKIRVQQLKEDVVAQALNQVVEGQAKANRGPKKKKKKLKKIRKTEKQKVTKDHNTLLIELSFGQVLIEMYPEFAPKHVARIKELAKSGKYDGVAFHRVIDGFMAQTGDVQFGNMKKFNPNRVGTGGCDKTDLPAEFNSLKHVRGTCSMARSSDPNSANSQFFICFDNASFLDDQYTVWGKVIEGMEHVDKIKRGEADSGSVADPDFIKKVMVQ